jgi:glucokinase
MSAPVVAVDLGGTRVKVGLVVDGEVVGRGVIDSASADGLEARLPVLGALIDDLLDGRRAEAVGFAMPGIVDRRTRRLVAINAKWSDAPKLDLRRWVQQRWGVGMVIENDAVAALAGEWRYGAARGADGAVMVTLGTGIGVAAVVDGHLLHGSHGQAAIAGHLTVEVGGRLCTCGNLGCAEAEASTSVLESLARDDRRFPGSALAQEPVLDYATVFALAESDTLARDLRGRAIDVWSALLVSLVHAYDPEVIVIGGGIAAAGPDLFEPLRAYVGQHAWTPSGAVDIVESSCGVDAAILGIGALVTAATQDDPETEDGPDTPDGCQTQDDPEAQGENGSDRL